MLDRIMLDQVPRAHGTELSFICKADMTSVVLTAKPSIFCHCDNE